MLHHSDLSIVKKMVYRQICRKCLLMNWIHPVSSFFNEAPAFAQNLCRNVYMLVVVVWSICVD